MQIDPIYWKVWWQAIAEEYNAKDLLYSVGPDQQECKKWLVDYLPTRDMDGWDNPKIHLYGGWYGYPLIDMLLQKYNRIHSIINIDIDQKAIDLCRRYTHAKELNKKVDYKCQSVIDPIDKSEDVRIVINTSSEHMPDLPEIIKNKNYKDKCIFMLQSNNMEYVEDHINCVSSEQEFIDKSGLSDILYSGTHQMNNGYERYMVIGRR